MSSLRWKKRRCFNDLVRLRVIAVNEEKFMIKFLRNIDYSTKGDVLSGFTDEVVKNILIDYYQNNLKLNEIIKKYSIHTIASNLRKEFPKVSTSFICEICDEEKYIQLPTKTDYNKLVNNDQLDNYFVQDNRCFSCGHKNNDDDCSCDYCSKEKRQKILDTYFLEEIRYISGFGLREQLYLSTILQGFNISEDEFDIPSFSEIKNQKLPQMFFDGNYPIDEIYFLKEKNILEISPRSSTTAFCSNKEIKQDPKFANEKFPNVFYKTRVRFSFQNLKNVYSEKDEHWFSNFKFLTNLKFTETEINQLWLELAEKELFKLFDYQFREEFHFEYSLGYSEKDENKAKQLIRTEIKNLLFEYSPSKVYCILYQGVKKAVTHKQKYGMTHYRDNQVQFVISYGIKSWLKYNEERISDYDYPWTLEMSLVSTLFFKNILQNDEWFYNLIPIDKVEIIEQDFVEYFRGLSQEKQLSLLEKLSSISEYSLLREETD